MIEIGRLVVKISGRDAGGKAVIIDVIDDNYVLIDGQVRRRKCNIKHIEPLELVVKISKGAGHDSVVSELKKLGIEVKEKKGKKEKTVKPKKLRGKRKKAIEKKAKSEKPKKKEVVKKEIEEKVEKKEVKKVGEKK